MTQASTIGQKVPENRAETPSRRFCGSCSVCCEVIPIEPMRKAAGQRCPKQRSRADSRGCCSAYADRPSCCKVYSCSWLDGYGESMRPDLSGVLLETTHLGDRERAYEDKAYLVGQVVDQEKANRSRASLAALSQDDVCVVLANFDGGVQIFGEEVMIREWFSFMDHCLRSGTVEHHMADGTHFQELQL